VKKKVASKNSISKKLTAKKKTAPKVAEKKAKSVSVKKSKALSNLRIGVMGGVFNPVHVGHLNSALSVKEALNLDHVFLVPSYQAPHREVVGPNVEDRVEMLKLAAQAYHPELQVSDLEIIRKGKSFTYQTLEELNKNFKTKNIFFIMGADNFKSFPQWKNFESLLQLSNFVVTTRPGSSIQFEEGEIPSEIAGAVKKITPTELKLKSGTSIRLIEINDIDVSSTEIRKRLRVGHEVKNLLPPTVVEYIETNSLYKRTLPLVKDYRDFSIYCGNKARDRKALGLKMYDMTKNNGYADYSIICSATSTKHASSIADGIIRSAKEDFGLSPIGVEGVRDGRWVLIDFGPVVVHVFEDAVRGQYQLEQLWKNCRQFQDEISNAT
jgi:nicotinate-nucleotide adenylyltransferase